MDLAEALQNAALLRQEGFSADAKKTIHQVLMSQPGYSRAQSLLDEIQKAEIKLLLEQDRSARPSRSPQDPVSEEDPDLLLRKLDQELQLGLFSFLSDSDSGSPVDRESIEAEVSEKWIQGLEAEYPDLSVDDRVNLGIAFLEMGLSTVATYFFSRASQGLNPENPNFSLLNRSVVCLLALSLLHQGKAYEAFFYLQPLVGDREIRNEDKLELFYLMGRSYEFMNKIDLAAEFFLQVWNVDPNYRDIERRLRKKNKPIL
jgi:tetratricopeptide (TPR) repeat protein